MVAPAPSPAHIPPLKLAALGVVVALGVLALKFLAYRLTGSVALLSDALESIINVVASGAALLALWVAARPADANHPYGHTKAEYLSAVAEGVLIVLAAVGILRLAVPDLFAPRPVEAAWLGLGINVLASLVNGVWAAVLLRAGRRTRSPALLADGQHILTDVITSVGVVVGVVLAVLTGWAVLDPLLAILVALNILWSGWGLLSRSVGGLMDAGVDSPTETRIRQAMSEHAEGALEMHDLRTRTSGAVTFIDFHLVVPGEMSVREAHTICDRLEDALKAELDDVQVTIHVEPQDQAKHHGVLVI
ncbi:cation diffusion facilitator family transporter [Deinococcus petrolearius]|uniref:Cation diffusion facilitator family transporter n=1 Tax=Deinococcus petrolearius TaxID=1751295 RepID=A0ABW1DGW3_9DEIO